MDYYISIDHQHVPVSEEVYKAWCKGDRKERYFREGDISNGVFSYHALDTEDYNGCDLFADPAQPSTEAQAETRVLLEQLPHALETLTPSERHLLLRLYVYEESLRQIARAEQIPVTTLHYRHRKALKKLREALE